MKNILLLVNGAGLGNSVRMFEVHKELNHDFNVFVLGSGNAIDFFKSNGVDIIELEQLEYGVSNGSVDILKTLSFSNLKNNIKKINNNNHIIKELLNEHVFDLAIIDSFYSIGALKKNNIKIYAVNNSNILKNDFINIRKQMNFKNKMHFYFIEYLDYLFHKKNVMKSFSLTFEKKIEDKVFKNTPLITKSGVKKNVCDNNAILMLSGAGWKSDFLINHQQLLCLDNIFILGIAKEKVTSHVKNTMLLGRDFNALKYLNESKVGIINAGFSAISEMIVARKPMIVIPIGQHSEQFFNAKWIESKGLGICSDEDHWQSDLLKLLDNYDWYKKNYDSIDDFYINGNGASYIVDELKKDLNIS